MSYYQQRQALLENATHTEFGLIVIGGGITGSGIALDAQTRGIPTLLIEMNDLASGTSSRSTKLIHGGLRYLKQLEFGLVQETGRERAVVHHLAPHITVPEPMLLPIIKGGSMPQWMASLGTWIYDLLAGVKKSESRQVLDKAATLEQEPLLAGARVTGGIHYYEYRTDDARLTMAVAHTAQTQGAVILTYAKVIELIYEAQTIVGVKVLDTLSNKEYTFKGIEVVNASGPWVDGIDAQDADIRKDKLLLTKGVHVVVDYAKFPIKQAAYFDVGDGRMVFAIPREGKTYIGTTDTKYTGSFEEPGIEESDKKYLIECVTLVFPTVQLKEEDIESYWSGLRPLIRQKDSKSPSAISRKDEIFTSKTGLLSIAGGKLTGYRKMAERITDILAERLKDTYDIDSCTTEKHMLYGGDIAKHGGLKAFIALKLPELTSEGIDALTATRLIRLYGSNIEHYVAELHQIDERIALHNLPKWLKAQLQYTIKHEFVCKPEDFIIRRTADFYFRRNEAEGYYKELISCMQILLSWTDQQRIAYTDAFQLLLKK
ncbi:glycerol-3-phosphate dehydrogenase/oxidase [Cytophaga aurantiaca]|uniref:glycerol-3-phosphate dehydrogenase/oxidase n=1 Tax=Cytophaga aurantiaca TaxID=29530 RepID=UPI00037D30E4|nr:glycerol-3-phosphate dehydrogenase/oxidase [Cytophaga aurantiaca]